MSADANRDLVRRWYQEVVSTGDVSRVAEFIAPGYEEVYQNVRYPVAMEGAREHVLGVLLAVGAIRIADPVEDPQDDPEEHGGKGQGDA